MFSTARSFNGTSQKLQEVGVYAPGYLLGANVFTVMCWMKPTSIAGTPQSVLFTSYSDGTDRSWRVQFGYTTATVEFTDSQDGTYITSSGLSIPDTNWHHVCYRQNTATYDKFLDGAKTVISTSFGVHSLFADAATHSFYVAERSTFANYFSGALAEIALWTVALADSDIAAIANSTGTVRPNALTTGLLGYWPLGLNSPEPDESGNNIPLTLINAPTITDGPYVTLGPAFGLDAQAPQVLNRRTLRVI